MYIHINIYIYVYKYMYIFIFSKRYSDWIESLNWNAERNWERFQNVGTSEYLDFRIFGFHIRLRL